MKNSLYWYLYNKNREPFKRHSDILIDLANELRDMSDYEAMEILEGS